MITVRRATRRFRLAAFLFCVAAFALQAAAQSNRGTILGVVRDPNGAVVKDAKVTATNVATGEAREATTDDEGNYSIPALEPGNYTLRIEAAGFQPAAVEAVKLETGARQAVDVALTVGNVGGDTVVVTAEAPLAETETSVRGDLITGQQVTDLPIPQRNFTLLATLSPGVTRPFVGVIGGGGNFEAGGNPVGTSTESTRFRESGGSVLVVNGARPTNNNFTLDGTDNNEGQFGQIGIYPPPDAIAEFRIETSVAPAEAGRAGGGIISTTTKSGGNDLHGSLYEFYQGRVLSARSRQDKRNEAAGLGLTNRNTHQFGGTVGGPVFLPRPGEGTPYLYDGRNRTFWFAYYEGQRNATPSTTGDFGFVSVPTARMRVGDFGELLRPGTSQTYNTVNGPVVAPRGTVFCGNGLPAPSNDIRNCGQPLSPAALNVLQAYPLPNVTGRIFDNFQTNRKEKYNRNGWGLRFDHNISQSDTLFLAYSSDKSSRARDNNFPIGSSPTGNDLPSGFGAGNEFGDSRGVRLGETHTFSPTVINDARFGATRVEIGIFNTGVGGALGFDPNISANLGIPRTNICGECTGVILLGIEEPFQGGRQNQLEFIGDGGPFYFTSNNFSFGDALTWVRGTSTFKFGGDLRVRQNSNFDAGRAGAIKGQYQYGTGAGGFLAGNYNVPIGPQDSGSGAANFLLGYNPGFTSRGTPGTPPFLSNREISFFGQDDWKVSPTLTLNLGLRWDFFTQPVERFDAQANYNPSNDTLTRAGEGAPGGRDLVQSDFNNFGPSLGFSWSGFRDDKTVVLRGGYALKYAVDTPGIPGVLQANSPQAGSYGCSFNQLGTAACPQLPARFNLDTGIPLPLVTLNVAPGQTFSPGGGASVVYLHPDINNEMFHQYNLTGQWEFMPNWLAEVGYVGSRGRNLLVVRNIGNSGGGFPGARIVNTRGTVQEIDYTGKSWYDSLQTKLEKRYSRGLSIITSYVWSHAIDNSPGNFCTGGTGPSTCGFANPLRPELDKASADFDVRHRFSFASVWELPFGRGRRFGSDISRAADLIVGGWQINTDLYIQSGPPYSVFANGRRVDLIGDPTPTAEQRARGLELNPAAFREAVTPVFASDPGGPKFGNLGRNVFRGERQEFVNLSVFKNLNFTETVKVQLRAQAYNLFNHVNGFRPDNNLTSGNFGIDTSEQRRRQLEVGLRLVF
ncbi:MAG TPA: TonB-dependent receptor [Pyrinomonadaceae bacterium]|nr:TonB-dependent receptor [Pyrinomonadaceae bacterium]